MADAVSHAGSLECAGGITAVRMVRAGGVAPSLQMIFQAITHS